MGGDAAAREGAESSVLHSRKNEILGKHGFDDFAEAACKPFYAERMAARRCRRGCISGCC